MASRSDTPKTTIHDPMVPTGSMDEFKAAGKTFQTRHRDPNAAKGMNEPAITQGMKPFPNHPRTGPENKRLPEPF